MQPADQLQWEAPSDGEDRDGRSAVVTALHLGWWLADAFHTVLHPHAWSPEAGDGSSPEPPRKLANFTEMPVARRLRMYLDGVDVALTRIAASTADGRQRPSTAAARSHLDRAGPPWAEDAAELLSTIDELNMDVLRWTMATDHRVGLAYRLGRSLADTVRNCELEPLPPRFNGRQEQLSRWLRALAGALPPFSAEVVRGSLRAWTTAVDAANTVEPWSGTPTVRGLAAAVRDQGELWRGVLTGELDPRDLLDEDDYAVVAQRLIIRDRRLVVEAVRGIFRPVLVPLLAALLAVVGVSALAASGSPTTRAAIALVGLGGGLAAIWRSVSRPALAVAGQVNRPLLDAELIVQMVDRVTEPLWRAGARR
ncbi:hypothetical protein [Micromonospora mirobrigensis]|uniref:Uncharacterized protein n=1 Tax=Micromonospora mirobrigensis TaxID=262898 RepID=A0A1C4ZRH1_9ACTN|nr:hypothetical protein [Micromonospora mirobrigensis]SCF35630.1 hypothetical protein GA0070564_106233 [Micromonospora mirobrigensis]